MRKLVFSSLLLVACHAREKSVDIGSNSADSTSVQLNDSLTISSDSVRAIKHGSPDQAKLDSMKNAKGEKKKMDLF